MKTKFGILFQVFSFWPGVQTGSELEQKRKEKFQKEKELEKKKKKVQDSQDVAEAVEEEEAEMVRKDREKAQDYFPICSFMFLGMAKFAVDTISTSRGN